MIASSREENQRRLKKALQRVGKLWSHFGGPFIKGMLLGLVLLLLGGYGAFRVAYFEKIFPGVRMGTLSVSGKTADEAVFEIDEALEDYIQTYEAIVIYFDEKEWRLPLDEFGLNLDKDVLRSELMAVGRTGSMIDRLSEHYNLLFGDGVVLQPPLIYEDFLLDSILATASAAIDNPAIPPRVFVGQQYNPETKSFVVVERGFGGQVVLSDETKQNILNQLSLFVEPKTPLLTKYEEIQATETQIAEAIDRAVLLSQKSLTLSLVDESEKIDRTWDLQGKDLVSFLSVTQTFDNAKIYNYIGTVSESVNRKAQNALFQFDASNNLVKTFKPAKKGLVVQPDLLAMGIKGALEQLLDGNDPKTLVVSVEETNPEIDTGSANELGIETLLGRGESTYYNSIASRKHNVEFAAQKFNGVLISPGETFSFNEVLGEVSAQTGFLQAYIIRDGRTLLGDGGGVCQDSTTLFRAVLDAGLPITSWQNHSFRVGYYEQNSKPGFDATVYQPAPDFRFLNDTPGHILIQTNYQDMRLVFELYGTDDGRVAEVSNYTQWDYAPPPPDLHQDDPSLPAGTVKQVETAVAGLKTKFDYTVTRDDKVIFEKTFLSVFKPWRAIYLHGTGS